jgi:hypothetical protein
VISAIAAQGASAAPTGTTSHTCKKTGSVLTGLVSYDDADCGKPNIAGNGEYHHFEIPPNTKTELSGKGGTAILKTTIAGAGVELTATSVTPNGAASMENSFAGEEHYTHGQGSLTYNGVTVNLPNCTVEGVTAPGGAGMISTEQLEATTKGVGMSLKFKPLNAGEIFAEFKLVGASCAVNGLLVKVTGSVEGTPSGANVVFTHAGSTTQGTLKANGKAAGIDGTLTLEARAKSTEAYTPLSVTTPGE